MRAWLVALVTAVMAVGIPVSTSTHVVIYVDADAVAGGNGSRRLPYHNLPEAVAAARIAPGTVIIKVAPGDYPLAEPLVIESSIELQGSTKHSRRHDAWPTGEVVAGTETRIFAAEAVAAWNLVLVGRTDGSVLRDVRISGFVLEGTEDGIEVLLTRVQGYWIADNIFRGPAFLGMQSVASSGLATGNHFSGVGTGAILTGGYPASPSTVVFAGNRSVRNNLGGLLLNGASINIPELGDELHAIVSGNDLSDNTVNPLGFGLRLFILRRDPGAPGDTQSSSLTLAAVSGNRINGNQIGISIDAGFPYRRVGTVCDTRVFTGAIGLHLARNTMMGSLLTTGLVTFTRNMAAVNPSLRPQWQYLHGATFAISDRDGTLANAQIDHPQFDPFVGPCPGDASNELLGNVLLYNGVVVPHN